MTTERTADTARSASPSPTLLSTSTATAIATATATATCTARLASPENSGRDWEGYRRGRGGGNEEGVQSIDHADGDGDGNRDAAGDKDREGGQGGLKLFREQKPQRRQAPGHSRGVASNYFDIDKWNLFGD